VALEALVDLVARIEGEIEAHAAGEALGLAAFLSLSLAAMITHAPHQLARMQGGDS
jgi:hypothetical protein